MGKAGQGSEGSPLGCPSVTGFEKVTPCASGLEPLWIPPGITAQEGGAFVCFNILVSPTKAGISYSDEKAFSKLAPGTRFTPSGWACITAVVLQGEGLDWGIAIKRSDDMVVVFSFDTFTHDELLAGRLASDPGIPTSSVVGSLELSAPCPATVVAFACALAGGLFNPLRGSSKEGKLLVSSIRRIPYQFVNSNTGAQVEVIKAALSYV